MKKIVISLMVGLFLVAGMSTAGAVVITGSGTGGLSGLTLVPTLPITPDATKTYSFNLGASNPDLGTITQNVYKNRTTEGVTGVLFTYKITRTGAGEDLGLYRVSMRNFSEASKLSLEYDANDTGAVKPNMASYVLGTAYFDWDFNDLIHYDDMSKTFFVQTDVNYWKAGSVDLLGSGSQQFEGKFYAPTATPEPATAALLTTGLLGLLGFRKKKVV